MGIIGIIIFFIYKLYCNRTFETAHFRYCNDKKLFRELIGFSGWSIFSGVATVSNAQGTNILINIFCGVTVNAVMGIAVQVNSAVYQFVSNFQTAFNPQIIKSYSAKDYDYFMRLIFQTSKFSYFLLLFFVLPLYIYAELVLQLWLKNVPEYTIAFTRLILIYSLIDAVAGPLWMSVQATGDIKKYQIIVSFLILANLPLSFLFLWLGFSPIWVLIIKIGLNVLTLIWRMYFLSNRINLHVFNFLKKYLFQY
jgi:O-antigen/teichoic acid export membrane protein